MHFSRRELLKAAGCTALSSLPLSAWAQAKPTAPPPVFSPEDDQLLDEVERLACCFFCEQASPQTGLVKDRCNARKASTDSSNVASIAATGFGLTALCIGDLRGFIPHADARTRVIATLKFLSEKLAHHRGFYYHFGFIETQVKELNQVVN